MSLLPDDLFQDQQGLSQEFHDKTAKIMNAVKLTLSLPYPQAAHGWITKNRPDIVSELDTQIIALRDAKNSGDFVLFVIALDEWKESQMKAWTAYDNAGKAERQRQGSDNPKANTKVKAHGTFWFQQGIGRA